MKDFFGNTLNINDDVAFAAPGYRLLVLGTIVSFTPQKVRVEYVNTWNYGTPGVPEEYLSLPKFLIKKVKDT